MSTAAVSATCLCGSLSKEVVLCPDHHQYHREGRQLASVSSVLRGVWPEKPDYSNAPADRLENARDRGVEVDALFCAWIEGRLERVPAGGARVDSAALLWKLCTWWRIEHSGHSATTQVILADHDMAGTCDLIIGNGDPVIGGGVWDLKTTYNIEPSYALQVGLYGLLYEAQYGIAPEALGIIHLTERFKVPKVINLPVAETMADAALIRDTWRMAQRRLGRS